MHKHSFPYNRDIILSRPVHLKSDVMGNQNSRIHYVEKELMQASLFIRKSPNILQKIILMRIQLQCATKADAVNQENQSNSSF